MATAFELFECRHYPGVVAMCTDALEDEPEGIVLLVALTLNHDHKRLLEIVKSHREGLVG